MRKLVLLLGMVCLGLSGMCQQPYVIERQVITPLGGYNAIGGVEMCYTIGQPVVTTVQSINGQFLLRQGFQQNDDILTSVEKPIEFQVSYKIFPNPTKDKLTIELSSEKLLKLHLELFDMAGKKTTIPGEDVLLNGEKRIQWDLSSLPAGTYNLKFQDRERKDIKSFRIQRKH